MRTLDPAASVIVHTPNFSLLKGKYGDFPILVDERGFAMASDTSLVSREFIKGLIEITNATKNDPSLRVNFFTTQDPVAGVFAIISKPWKIRYLPTGDVGGQLNSLKIILQNNKPAEYVDVRFGQRIYWK